MQSVQQSLSYQSCGPRGMPSADNGHSGSPENLENRLHAKPRVILFDVYKQEAGDPSSSYCKLKCALKRQGFQCRTNEVSLTAAGLHDVGVIVFGQPMQPFTAAEFQILKEFLETGGSLLVLIGEGGETRAGTNINYFLEEYGMTVCADGVVRMTVASSVYLHPKEVFIGDGVLCRGALNMVIAQQKRTGYWDLSKKDKFEKSPTACLVHTRSVRALEAEKGNAADVTFEEETPFVFPYGATISVQKPAFAFLSSGLTAHPSSRPLAAAYVHPNGGRLVSIGSFHIFDNDFLDKENNPLLQLLIFQWLLNQHEGGPDALRPSTEVEASLEPSQPVPDTTSLSERPLPCFHDTEEVLLSDFRKLFEKTNFALDTSHVSEVRQLYRQLGVKYEPLSVIAPEFVTPLPPLRPAVYPPILPNLPGPPLELFDIDAEIASPRTRLIQLANQCVDDSDLEIHLQRAAQIVPVPLLPGEDKHDPTKERSAKNILCSLIYKIVELKKRQPRTTTATDEGSYGTQRERR